MGKSAENLLSADPVLGEVDRFRRASVSLSWGELAESTVRPAGVVVLEVLGKHLSHMVLIDDQQPVEEHRSHPAVSGLGAPHLAVTARAEGFLSGITHWPYCWPARIPFTAVSLPHFLRTAMPVMHEGAQVKDRELVRHSHHAATRSVSPRECHATLADRKSDRS